MSALLKLMAKGAEGGDAIVKGVKALRQALRLDSWSNTLTGLNTWRDKTSYMLPFLSPLLTPQQLQALYHNDDIATRIVAALPKECFREPWKVAHEMAEQDDDSDELQQQRTTLEKELKRLKAWKKMKEAMIWGRLYGLGAVHIGANDGQTWDQPLDVATVKSVDFLTVYDKRDLTAWTFYNDMDMDGFREVAQYQLLPIGVGGRSYEGGTPPVSMVVIHESRLIRFGGELTAKREELRNQGCSYSVLQKCFRALQLTNNNWQSASTLLADAGQGVFKIRGLIDMITQQPDIMQSRMQAVDMMRSSLRAIILDAGDAKNGTPSEEFERVATPFTGVPEMLAQTWNRLACAAETPIEILMGGRQVGGLNDSQEIPEWWYNNIEAEQRDKIIPEAERLLAMIAAAEGIANADEWTVKPGMLRRSSPQQQADIDLKHAQRDQIMVTKIGAWTPEEVALSRDADPTGNTTHIDTKTRKVLVKATGEVLRAEQDKRIAEAKMPPEDPNAKTAPAAKKA